MYVTVGDARYAYTEFGQGEPVLLLHGFTGKMSTWSDTVQVLSEQFRIITLDLPGHGQTVVDSPRTMESFCHDLKQILDALHIKNCTIIGYSLGGRVGLSFAMMYPGYVEKLVLESASPGLDNEADRLKRKENDDRLADRIEREGLETFVNHWENTPLFGSQRKLSEEIRERVRNERLSQTEAGLAMSLRAMGTGVQPSWWDQLENFEIPTLLLAGELDPKFVNTNRQMHDLLPKAKIHIVQNAGHAIHVEKQQNFDKVVKRFLAT